MEIVIPVVVGVVVLGALFACFVAPRYARERGRGREMREEEERRREGKRGKAERSRDGEMEN